MPARATERGQGKRVVAGCYCTWRSGEWQAASQRSFTLLVRLSRRMLPFCLRAAGWGQGLTQERQALWGWRTVMGRALHRTSTASSTTLLPPDLELILCLVWALISLPPKSVWKIPSLRLPREGVLCHSLLQPSRPLRPPQWRRQGERSWREGTRPSSAGHFVRPALASTRGAGKAATPPPLLPQVLAVTGICLLWEGLPKQLP